MGPLFPDDLAGVLTGASNAASFAIDGMQVTEAEDD